MPSIEELEKRVAQLEAIIESIALGLPWSITRGAMTTASVPPPQETLEPVTTIQIKR